MSERAFHMTPAEVGPMREIDAQALRGILDGSTQVQGGRVNLGCEALQRYEEGRA